MVDGTKALSARDETPSETAPAFGVVFDLDGVLRLAPLGRQLIRLWALVSRDAKDRRSPLSMTRVLQVLSESEPGVPVYYLTALPSRLERRLRALLRHDRYPPGTLLTAGRALVAGWLVGAGLSRKRAALARLLEGHPQMRWVLVGDDAGHDPALFGEFGRTNADRVRLIAMRQVLHRPDGPSALRLPDVTVVEAPNGEEMLPRLRGELDLGVRSHGGVEDWFLTAAERGNPATRQRAWTTGNAVRPLVHGATYFPAVADRLAAVGAGDSVLHFGWRADSDQLLADGGPTLAEALVGAARGGARVRCLLWRSHLALLGYHVAQNRALAQAVDAEGGEVLLDQRVLPLGSHHQKLVVFRHEGDPRDDVAFVGGIDLDLGARDGISHRGDPQTVASDDDGYTHSPRHDVQIELRGPVVADLEETFRERWDDPARLARLPWHAVPDRLHRLPRTGTPLPAPAGDPPPAGRCAVQVLRTYPRRHPPHPFAPRGERSVARAYLKALDRAQRLIYVEDQYLWAVDVARIFAAALSRSPQLHLIAVAPRRQNAKEEAAPAALGQDDALAMIRAAGGDRVQVLDVENHDGVPTYVHSKVCVVDDVWALVGGNNLNTRSWTHDSELATAVLDDERDPRSPTDPAGLGDGARGFARRLRLELMREHLDLDDDADLLDPDRAAETVRSRADALDAWYAAGRPGARPPGRLRHHDHGEQRRLPRRHRWFTVPAYRLFLDPDGRPLGMRVRRAY